MPMTKKNYEQIADAIVDNVRHEGYSDYRICYSRFVNDLCRIFERDNKLFNETIFRERAKVERER